jgi:hypothetical protein
MKFWEIVDLMGDSWLEAFVFLLQGVVLQANEGEYSPLVGLWQD